MTIDSLTFAGTAAVQIIARKIMAGSSAASAKVLALTQGVLKTMLLDKMKAVTAMAIVSLGLAWGMGHFVHELVAAQAKQSENGLPKSRADQVVTQDAANAKTKKNGAPQFPTAKSDRERLMGIWKLETLRLYGDDGKTTDLPQNDWTFTFAGDKFESRHHATLSEGIYTLDSDKKYLDWSKTKALYQFDGEKLVITKGNGHSDRPDENAPAGRKITYFFTRAKVEVLADPEAIRAAAVRRNRLLCGANLKRLVLAMGEYHDAHGCYPPAATTDDAGKPLLSWRVALLPYLGEKELFDQFRQNEPWDSAHNHKLLAKMPKIFASLGNPPKSPHGTFYQVFAGENTLFEPGRKIKAEEVRQGTVNVLAIVTAPDAVPWTRPADLAYESGKTLPSLVGGMFDDGLISFATAGAGVHLAPNTIAEDLLRKLIVLSNDGEAPDFEALRKLLGE